MPTFGTRAEFAARINRNKSTITRLAQADRLVFSPDGLIDFEASLDKIAATADPSKLGVVKRHARERGDQAIERELFAPVKPTGATPAPPPEAPAGPNDEESSYARFNEARALKEAELATLAKYKREEQEGQLIRRDVVKRDIETLAAIVSKGITSIPARIMPLINAEADAGKREQILESQLRAVLAEFADAALALTAD